MRRQNLARFFASTALSLGLVGLSFYALVGCTKGGKTASAARLGGSWKATPGELQAQYPPNKTISDPLKFVITTKEGSPVPNIAVEFRAFDVTPAYNAGVPVENMKQEILSKWNDGNFVMGSNGSIASSVCDAGFTREVCVGLLSGPSRVTNQNGEATVGFTTPNSPGGVIAVAVRVPENTTAADLIEILLIKITPNDDFANSGIEPLQSALLVIPMLFDNDGRQVIQAGVSFNLAVYAPGIPNTQPGKGFMFDFATEGLLEAADGSTVVVPSGSKRCEFRNSQCIVPGGPFRVLKPTTLSFSAKPSDPKFPVRPASISIPVITGQASQLIIALSPDTKNIQNACADEELINKACLVMSADIDKKELYPMLLDAGGNWVESPDTVWSVESGPLMEAGRLDKTIVTSGKQTIYPLKASDPGIVYDTIKVSVKGKSTYTYLKYLVTPGAPRKVKVTNQKQIATVAFPAIMELKDRYNNFCYNFTDSVSMKLTLSPLGDVVIPPLTGLKSTVSKVGFLDHSVDKVTFTNGLGQTVDGENASGGFVVAKVPPPGDTDQWPKITIDQASLSTGSVYLDVESLPLQINPGPIVQTLWRDSSAGGGLSYNEKSEIDPVLGIRVAADQQYNFHLAGYDAAANYAGDITDAKFWGVNYTLDDKDPTVTSVFKSVIDRLFSKDPSSYNSNNILSASCPTPDKVPLAGRPLSGLPNQEEQDKENATYGLPTNQPEENAIYCGIHLGLGSKGGVSVVSFNSKGIPGTGRILAIPNGMYDVVNNQIDYTNLKIKPAITPRLTLVAGAATKFGFEFRSAEEGPTLDKTIYSSSVETSVATGQKFKIFIHAQDNEGSDSETYNGLKILQVRFTGEKSWAGIDPQLPSGEFECEFDKGICQLTGTYMLADARSPGLLAVKQLTSGGVQGTFAKIISTKIGTERRLFFATKKGGPSFGAVPETSMSRPTGRIITADDELPLAVAVCDAGGSYIRDTDAGDGIVYEGFKSSDGSYGDIFSTTTGDWKFPTLWNSSYDLYDVFVADSSKSLDVTAAKFYSPDDATVPPVVTLESSKDTSKYSTVFVPQNRFGAGFAVPRSASNASLIGWPSSWWSITPGLPEHIETKLTQIGSPSPAWTKPGLENATSEQKQNWVSASNTCYDMTITIHDKKHNQLFNYTGVVDDVVLKLMNVTSLKVNGVDDELAGVFLDRLKDGSVNRSYYSSHNASLMKGPYRDGFYLTGMDSADGGDLAHEPAKDFNGVYDLPNSLSDWWRGRVSISTGIITTPIKVCLYNGQTASNYTSEVPYAEKFIQLDVPGFQTADKKFVFPSFQSRGAGVPFVGPNGKTIQSLSSPHIHGDKITVFRGDVDHLHPTFVDDTDNTSTWFPNLNISTPSLGLPTIGVTDKCPATKCGATTIYWHEHDEAHNYIRPARTTGFMTHSTLASSAKRGADGPIPLQSPSSIIFDAGDSRLIETSAPSPYRIYARNNWVPWWIGSTDNNFKAGALFNAVVGPPVTLQVTRTGPSTLTTETPFGVKFEMFDVYGNAAGAQGYQRFHQDQRAYFTVNRTLSVHYDKQPSNGPTSGVPKLMNRTGNSLADAANPVTKPIVANPTQKTFSFELAYSADADNIHLVKSEEPLELVFKITDDKVVPWCAEAAGNCLSTGYQQLSATLPVSALAGAPKSTVITSGVGISAIEYPSETVTDPGEGYAAIFNTNPAGGETYPLGPSLSRTLKTYACAKDAFGNLGECASSNQFYFINQSNPSPVETLSNMLNVGFFSWRAARPGTFAIKAIKNGFTAISAPITIGARPLRSFKFDNVTTTSNLQAGGEFQVKVCMVDEADNVITSKVFNDLGQPITDPDAELDVAFALFGMVPNPEGRSVVLSMGSGPDFESKKIDFGNAKVDFEQGCSNLYAQLYAKGTYNNVPLITMTYIDPMQSNKPFSGSGIQVNSVLPGAFDHYATVISGAPRSGGNARVEAWSNPGSTNQSALSGGNRFDATIFARDSYGNDIVYNNNFTLGLQGQYDSTPSSLELTCEAPDNNRACLSQSMSGAPVTIRNLAMDIPGNYFLFAKNSDGSGVNLETSDIFAAAASVKTIKKYGLPGGGSYLASNGPMTFTLTAEDNAGNPIGGIEDQLSALTFTWTDELGQPLSNHVAPFGVPGHPRFNGSCVTNLGKPNFDKTGVARFGIMGNSSLNLRKAEFVTINIRDNQTPSVTSHVTEPTQILPTGVNYDLTCNKVSDNSDCTGTASNPFPMDASPENRFKLSVKVYDDCGNETVGGHAVQLKGFSGRLEWLPSESKVRSGFGSPTTLDMLGNSQTSFTDLFVRYVGQANYYIFDPIYTQQGQVSNFAGNGTTIYHSYKPTLATVTSYHLKDIASTTLKTGEALTFKLQALDSVFQPVTGIDNLLGAQKYTWIGGGVAPNGEGPTYPTVENPSTTLTFINGVTGTLSATFKKSEQIFDFYVIDDFVPGASGVRALGGNDVAPDSAGRRRSLYSGSGYLPILVNEGLPYKFELTSAATTVKAGSPFDVKIVVLDKFANLVTGFGSDTLKFTWTGASSSIGAPVNPLLNAASTPPAVLAEGLRSFDPGKASFSSTGSPFVLYSSNAFAPAPQESPTLTVTGTKTGALTETGSPLTASLQFTVQPSDTFAYAKVGSASTWDLTTDFSGKPYSMSNDQTKVFFAHLFDPWGNYKGTDPRTAWTGSSILDGRLAPTPSVSTTLAPTLAGSGVVTISCTAVDASCVSDSTGTISVDPSPLKSFSVDQMSPAEGANITAGDEVSFKVCMRDKNHQVITSDVVVNSQYVTRPNSTVGEIILALSPSIQRNPEDNTLRLSTGSTTNFDANEIFPGSNSLTFVNGCASLYARVLAAGSYGLTKPLITLNYIDTNQNNLPVGGSGLKVGTVSPWLLDHYVTIPKHFGPTATGAPAWATPGPNSYVMEGGTRFAVELRPRDLFGNAVTVSKTVTLGLIRASDSVAQSNQRLKCGASGDNQECLTVALNNSSGIDVPYVALDIPGEFYISATDGQIKLSTLKSGKLVGLASKRTVKYYSLTSLSTAVAGQPLPIKIEARDAADQVISGADTDFKTLNFSWVDGSSVPLTTGHVSPAPSLSAPLLPPNPLPFNGGVANVSITLTKAETQLKINVKDDQSPIVSSANMTETSVSPGTSLYYAITCSKVIGSNCTGGGSIATAASINASPTDMFNLTLKSFDQFQNPKTDGAPAPAIKLTWESGANAINTGRLEQFPEVSQSSSTHQFLVQMSGKSQESLLNLFHRAGPHVISYSVDPLSANYVGMLSTTYHSYQPHIDMIYQYVFSPSNSSWPNPSMIDGNPSFVAGMTQNFKLLALDRAGNIVRALDPQLSSQKFLWKGPTPAPNGDGPLVPGPMTGAGASLTFNQGEVSGLSVMFKNAEVISDFYVIDDYAPSVQGIGYTDISGKRRSPQVPLTVINATPSYYEITSASNNVQAGSPFDVTVAVLDQFKNPAKTWTGDTLTFDWISGAGTSVDTPRSSPASPGKFPSGYRMFNPETASFSTVAQAGQKFVLYKAPETSTLKVTGTIPRSAGQPVLTGTLDFTTVANDVYGYVKIASSNTFDVTTSLSSPASFSMATNDTKTLYAHLFDPWGNYKSNTSPVYWTGTGKLQNRFNPISAAVTTLTTNEVGNGIVSASCSTLDSDCVGDSTGLVSVGASPLKDFVVEHTGTPASGATVLAGTEIPMRVCMLDKAGQRITDDVSVDGVLKTEATDKVLPLIFAGLNIPTTAESFSIELSSAGGANFNANKFALGSASLRFQSGCAPFFVKLYGVKSYSNAPVISISHVAMLQGGIIVSGSGLTIAAVTPGVLHHYFVNASRLSNSPAANSVPAWAVPGSDNNYADAGGNRFDVNVEARDAFGNLVTVADQSVTLSTVAADKTTPRTRSLICSAPNNDSSCLTKSFSGTSTTFSNLAIDVGGFTFYPVATSGSIATPNPFVAITATSSVRTVKSYEVSYPPNVTAGAEFTATVVAKDAAGALLIGADSELGALNFTWLDGAAPTRQLLSTHTAPNGQGPTGASVGKLTFTGGSATPKLTLTKVETGLIINVQDSQTPAIASTSTATTNVSVGAATFYALSCTRIDNSDCTGVSGSPVPMTGSAADKYNLIIKTFDEYNNPKAVTASPQISITRSGGASGVSVLEQFPAVASRDLNNSQLIVPMVNVNTATISNVFRRSATQTVSMQVDTATVSATGISGVVYHSYSPTIDTVYSYSINNLPTGNVVAGSPYTNITISARDRVGNEVDSISTDLNAQTFTWSGVGVAPNGTPPVLPGVESGNIGPIYPVSGLNFNNTGRTGTFTLTFYKAETLLYNSSSSFMIRDNYNGSAGSGGSMLRAYRSSQLWSDIIVGHAKASQYIMTSNASTGTNLFAGSPFDVTVKVFDDYLNPATTWLSDSLTFNWTTGAESSLGSPENPKTADVKAAVKPSGVVSATFTNGVFSTSSGAFTLFRSNLTSLTPQETSTLAVEGSTTANTKLGNVLGTSLSFTTQPAQAISYVKIAKADSFNSTTNMSGKALDFSNNQTLNLYAHVFDAYGNYKGNTTIVGWDGQGSLSGNVNPITGISTVVTPALTGSGFIKAICSSSITGCVDDQTGTIGVKSAPLASFSISHASTPAAGDTVSAGDEVPLQICMRDSKNQVITETVVDANNETITNPEAALDLSFAAINITNTSERGAIDLSTLGAGNFNGAAPAVRSVKFTSGCANFFAKVYKSGTYGATLPLLSVTYSDPKQQGITISGSGLKLAAVNAKALDHYVTAISNLSSSPQANSTQAWSNPGTTNSYASAGGNRFDVTAYARDIYGNPVSLSGQELNLSLVAADGVTEVNRSLICSAPNNDSLCLSPVISSGDSVTVGNLAVDIGGQSFYVKATDSNDMLFTSVYSTLMYSATSRKTVKQYVISAPSTAVAGVNTPVTVTAIDNSGATIIGADADLNNNLTFQWTDGTNLLSTHIAPDGVNTPILPSLGNGSRNFNAGTASANLSFAKAETSLRINVRDGQSPAVTSDNTSTTDVSAGTTLTYAITCLKDTGGAIAAGGDCSGNSTTAASILASATDRFTLNIRPYDQYKNPRAGNAAEVLQVDLLDGSAGGAIKGWLEQTSTSLSTNAANEPIVDTSNSGGINVSGLYHRVGNHKVSYSIATRDTTTWGQVYHTFSPSIDMVYSYDTSTIGPHAAGNSQSFTITAKDRAGNIAKNIDSGLNSLSAQAFSWYGASATPAPIYPSTTANAISFSGGVSSSLNVTFRKAETVNFYVQDNYAPKIVGTKTIGGAGTSGTRRSSAQAIAVSNAQASTFVITPSTTTPKAGDQFGVKVEAQDEFGNVVLNYSDTLAFSWLNATTILPNANNSKNPTSTFTPSAISSASMSSGSYNSGTSGLYLYKSAESPTLKVIGTVTNNTTLAGLEKTYTFTTVAPSAAYGYVRVTTANAYNVAEEISGSNDIQTDSPRFVFAHLFDPYGNPMPKSESVTWEGTGELLNKVTASGSSTRLAPTAEGSGTVTARCNAAQLTSDCASFTSGLYTIRPGNINKLVWLSPTPSAIAQSTEDCTEFRIQPQDASNTPVNVTQATPVTFTSTNGSGEFFATIDECNAAQAVGTVAVLNTNNFHNKTTGLVSGGSAGIRTKNIIVGESAVSVWYANRTPNSDAQVYADILGQYRSTTIRGPVSVGPTKRVALTSGAFEITAGGCGSISYKFQDKWANDRALATGATINLRSTAIGSSGAFHSNPGCSSAITGGERALNAGATGDTVYYTDAQANDAVPRILGVSDASGGIASTVDGNSVIQAQSVAATVKSGTFSVTTASGKSKYPFAINWGASTGARDYTVTYGADSTNACGSAIPGGVTVDSVNRSATFNSGLLTAGSAADNTYIICVRANGYTGSAGSGTPSRDAGTNLTFKMIVDNVAPTGSITAPSATSSIVIGPAMAEMGSGTDTIFRGTAADARAGVQNVEVRLQQGSNFWNGTNWSATTEQWLPAATSDSFATWSYTISDANMEARNSGASHTLTVRITDQAGNQSTSTTKTFTWKSSSSTAVLTGKPGNPVGSDHYWNGSTLNVSVTATSMAYYRYSIVNFGSTCTPSTEKTSGNITDPVGTDGKYVLCVLAYDVAGNAPTDATTHTFYRDTTRPTLSGLSSSVSTRSAYTPSITATDTGAPAGSVISYSWRYTTLSNSCSVNGVNTLNGVVGEGSLNQTFTITGCANSSNGLWGSPVLTLTATDSAGNTAISGNVFTLNYDAETPAVSAIAVTSPATGSYKVGQDVDIRLTFAKTAGNPNASSFNLSQSGIVDADNNTKPTLALSNITPTGQTARYVSLSGKTITFRYTIQSGHQASPLWNGNAITIPTVVPAVSIVDNIGNAIKTTGITAAALSPQITVDTTAPSLVFTSGMLPNANGSNKTTNLGITIADTDTETYQFDIVSAGASYPITGSAPTGSALQTICETGSYGSTWTAKATALTKDISNNTNFPQDNWVVICARGRDLALNEQPTASYTAYAWIKDTLAPAVPAITAPTSAQRFTSAPTVTWQTPAGDVNKIDLIVAKNPSSNCTLNIVERYSKSPTDTRLNFSSTKQLLSAYADGLYDVCLYTYDVAENKSSMSSTSFEIETDVLHIGWTDSTGVRYQTRSGVGNWLGSPETIASGTFDGRTSLALDANGEALLAYQYDNGTNSVLGFRQRTSGTWGGEQSLASSSSAGKTGLYAEVALDNSGFLVSTSYGLRTTPTTSQGLMVAEFATSGSAVRISTTAAAPTGVRDTSVTVTGAANQTYAVASMLNGLSLYDLRIINHKQGAAATVTLPSGCEQAPFASAFAYTDTEIGIAAACRSDAGVCTVKFVRATFSTANGTFTFSSGVNIGTIKASACALSDLTESHRPSLAINRTHADNGNSNLVGIVWSNSTKQIQYSTLANPTATTFTTVTLATGTGSTVGQQTLSFDKFGRAYVVYQDGDSIMFTNNNSGTWLTPALISTASVPPTVTGVGNIGITGMRGRGNTNGR